jgi:general secretion pathway protein I
MKQDGFTLIEVLAALLIFSVAIIGLSHSGTESVRAVSALDNKMLAGVVADNQLILARQDPAKVGMRTGQETAMSRNFTYDIETTKTETSGFYQLVVKVRAKNNEHVLIERTAFVQGAP